MHFVLLFAAFISVFLSFSYLFFSTFFFSCSSKGFVCWVYPFLFNFVIFPLHQFSIWAWTFHKYWCEKTYCSRNLCDSDTKLVVLSQYIFLLYFFFHTFYVLCRFFSHLLAFFLHLCTINLNYIDSLSLHYILSHLIIYIFFGFGLVSCSREHFIFLYIFNLIIRTISRSVAYIPI